MSRNFRCTAGIYIVSILGLAIVWFGGSLFLELCFDGISDMQQGIKDEFLTVAWGMVKVSLSGLEALLVIVSAQGCLTMIDRLRNWRLSH